MVIEQPERFLTLSLISSPVGGKLVDEDAMVKNQRLIKLFSTKGKGRWLTELWLQSPPHIFTALKKYVTKFGFISEIIDKHQWNELADNRFSLFTTTNQLIPGLQKIKSKVFLYVGEEDMEYIKRCNELLSRRLVNFERLYLADCGHLPILEKPPMVMGLIKQNIISIL